MEGRWEGHASLSQKMNGPRCLSASRGPRFSRQRTIFEDESPISKISALLRNLSGLDQRNIEIWRRLAFAPQSRNTFGLSAAQIMACLATFDHVRTVTSRLAG